MGRKAQGVGPRFAFVPKFMTWASFPYVDQKDSTLAGRLSHVYERELLGNDLIITTPSKAGGIPYGALPRLIMLWVAREAIRNHTKSIDLGRITDFMKELGIAPTGGKTGSITRLRNQMRRLFCSSIMSNTIDDQSGVLVHTQYGIQKTNLLWDPKNPDDSSAWTGELLLSDAFYDDIYASRLPVSLDALLALRTYPMAMDMIIWLGYKLYQRRDSLPIKWVSLRLQFGAAYGSSVDPNLPQQEYKARIRSNNRGFRRDFKKRMEMILKLYPVNIEMNQEGIILHPSPHVDFMNPVIPNKKSSSA